MRRTKAEAQETKQAILEAAEHVFFERGAARTTLEDVARAAGVTRGAVYWHFRDKSDLFNAVLEQVRMPMEDVFYRIVDTDSAGSLEKLETFCATSLVRLHDDDRRRRVYAILLLKCEYSAEMASLVERERAARDRATQALTRFFSRLQKAGRMTAAGEPRVLALALYAYMLGLYADYLRAAELYRMPRDAEKLVRHFFIPLAATPPADHADGGM
jgi:AcrR family transcriptional regulator